MISTLILTKNEEADLPGCLESVSWCDDVFVFDSCSTDGTAEVARRYGAHFAQREFDGYASQRNAAFEGLPFRHEWILLLDADERCTPELKQEIHEAIAAAPSDLDAFRIQCRYYLNGTWLKHSQMATYFIRLVRRGKTRYNREINEVMEVDGRIGDLKSPFDHFPFSKGMGHWIRKHDLYSTMEARIIAEGSSRHKASWKTALTAKDYHARRVAQKAIFYRLPGRPIVKWFYMMFVRGAILDGRAGITYVNLQTMYEYWIVLKTRELLRAGSPTSKSKQSAARPG